jgi:hypothetical protein
LFSLGGIPLWTPVVDDFLATRNLKLSEVLLSLPASPSKLAENHCREAAPKADHCAVISSDE